MGIKHYFDAVRAHFQTYQSKHFQRTKYGKQLIKLKGRYEGESCFIIGNGPSLSSEDLDRLYDAGIHCFASNNVMKMFSKTRWRPTFYVCEDLLVLEDLKEALSSIEARYKFIPINYNWYNDIRINGAMYFLQRFQKQENIYSFADDISGGIPCTGTVTITCMQLAAYMGFKNIYLLGIDHNYRQTQDSNGNIIVDDTVKDYFDQDYAATMKKKNIPNLEKTTEAYQQAKRFVEQKGIRLFNATRGGKLEVYPRIDFDRIIEEEIV